MGAAKDTEGDRIYGAESFRKFFFSWVSPFKTSRNCSGYVPRRIAWLSNEFVVGGGMF